MSHTRTRRAHGLASRQAAPTPVRRDFGTVRPLRGYPLEKRPPGAWPVKPSPRRARWSGDRVKTCRSKSPERTRAGRKLGAIAPPPREFTVEDFELAQAQGDGEDRWCELLLAGLPDTLKARVPADARGLFVSVLAEPRQTDLRFWVGSMQSPQPSLETRIRKRRGIQRLLLKWDLTDSTGVRVSPGYHWIAVVAESVSASGWFRLAPGSPGPSTPSTPRSCPPRPSPTCAARRDPCRRALARRSAPRPCRPG